MSVRLEDVLPLVIDVSKQPSDVELIDEFDWELGDNILVFLEDKDWNKYWDIFELVGTSSGEDADFVRPDGESLTELLENESVFLVRWIPIRFNYY